MTFTLRELELAALGGILLGAWIAARHKVEPRHQPFARLINALFEPLMYLADIKGADGRPSLTKTSYVVTLWTALYGVVDFGRYEVRAAGYTGLTWGYLAYVLMVLLFALGRQVFVQAFSSVETYIAGKFPAAAEVVKARQSSGSIQRPPEVL